MGVEGIVVLLVLFGGFFVAGAFRFRRMNMRDERLRSRREARRREHHFRGSLEFELEKGPRVQPKDDASA